MAVLAQVAPKTGTPASARGGIGVGKSPAELVRQVNRWRDSLNPLRSFTIQRAVAQLEAGERGEYADLQWTYRMIEKRYAILRALVVRRRAALLKMDWEIQIPSNVDESQMALAEEQQDYLRSRYDLIGNLNEAIGFLALAEFRGFSFLAKHKLDAGPDAGAVRELHWLPHWCLVRDGQFGDWFWNPEARQVTAAGLGAAARIDLSTVIYRLVDMPIDEIALLAFVRANLAEKDWIAFCEMYGIPRAIVILPPGEPPPDKMDDYRAAAEKISEGASGALPNGADAKFPSAAVRGAHPYKEYLDAKKEEVVLAGTGGKLSMLNEATGIGGSQGDVHDAAFDDLAEAEAMQISECFNRQFDDEELDLQFPGQPHLAYFCLQAKEIEDRQKLVADVVALKNAGWAVKSEQLEEKTGLEFDDEEEAPPTPAAAPAEDPEDMLSPELAGKVADVVAQETPEAIRNRLTNLIEAL